MTLCPYDEEGRLLTIHLPISKTELIVTNVYAPNSSTKYLFWVVTAHQAPYMQFPLLIGGISTL